MRRGGGELREGRRSVGRKNCGWNIRRNLKKINTNILGELVKGKSLKICQNDKVWFFLQIKSCLNWWVAHRNLNF